MKVHLSKLVQRLIGEGRAIRIFDSNIQLARLIGANKDYLAGICRNSRN